MRLYYFEILLFVLHLRSLNSSQITRHKRNESPTPTSPTGEEIPSGKLVVIMLDGFRWDYYNKHKQEMPALQEFLAEGVQSEWVEPIFPSVSYPSWTTISTGLFPESHGILGNYMYDKKTHETFELFNISTTRKDHWWNEAEPIWITATKSGLDVFLRYWSRCDVPFQGTVPIGCVSGFETRNGSAVLRETLEMAAQKIKDHDLVMVYNEHIDNLGHKYGPDSPELIQGLKDVNEALNGFLDTLLDIEGHLEDEVNVIITSDHGMIAVGPEENTTYLDLGNFIDPSDVRFILDKAAVVAIHPYSSSLKKVYDKLKTISGVDVYKREEIPERYHYKNHRLTQDLLLVAKRGYFIRGLNDPMIQVPYEDPSTLYWGGTHGYPDIKEMSGIFFARGPAFKKGRVHPPIHLEDIYQVMTTVLNIQPKPHNGSWDRVYSMFINESAVPPTFTSSSSSLQCLVFAISLLTLFLRW